MNVAFGEIVEYAIGGGWGDEEPSDGTVPVRIIRGADFPSAGMRNLASAPLRYEGVRKAAARTLREGDIVLEVSGGTKDRPTGRAIYASAQLLSSVPNEVIPASFCRLVRVDRSKASSLYAFYALQDLYARGGTWEYQNQSTGISNFQFEMFRDRWRLMLPSLPEQQAIAEVLGALDDKIAANTTLASTATQLASTDFAMVARQATKFSTFADVAEISGGGTPSTKNEEFWDGDIWWATPTDMTALAGPYLESTSRTITAAGLAACNSRLFEPGAILMTSRATIGALAVNSVPTALNQGFIVVEPHDWRLRWWLFHEMESRVDEFISWANGATFLELSRGNFKRLRVRLPSVEVRDQFAARAGALHDAARVALEENRTLAATRDALLPQLMSGKLRVREAERVVSEAGV
jgi:type I restriction enzyme S subunit